jgi:hypothetical protein
MAPKRLVAPTTARKWASGENPHARNEPDLDGNGPTDGVNDGRFTMTLDSFFRNFDLLRLATVEHEPQLGDFPMPAPNGTALA